MSPDVRAFSKWAFLVVPVIGLVELGLHVKQVNSVTPPEDWAAAKADVEKKVQPEDLITFAPKWVDPIGRREFGSTLANEKREAYPDVTRFPRAFEVSIRGAHEPALADWKQTDVSHFGSVTVTTYENPTPVKLLDDLVSHVAAPDFHVQFVDAGREQDCPLVHAAPLAGALGGGPAIPAVRYACPNGGNVGQTILADLDYVPRRCLFVPPPGGTGFLRLRYDSVPFGRAIHGHHAISVEQERAIHGAPVTIAFRVGDRDLGRFVHRDGDGWKPFEIDTSDLAGTKGELVVEISAPRPEARLYCFEADLR